MLHVSCCTFVLLLLYFVGPEKFRKHSRPLVGQGPRSDLGFLRTDTITQKMIAEPNFISFELFSLVLAL